MYTHHDLLRPNLPFHQLAGLGVIQLDLQENGRTEKPISSGLMHVDRKLEGILRQGVQAVRGSSLLSKLHLRAVHENTVQANSKCGSGVDESEPEVFFAEDHVVFDAEALLFEDVTGSLEVLQDE